MQTRPLRKKLASLRSRLRLLALLAGLFRFVAVLAALAAATFLLDWLFQLPRGARAVMLVASVGVAAWTFWRHVAAPQRVPMEDETLALLVESRHPDFGHQLISALQLEARLDGDDRGESLEMIRETVENAQTRFAGTDFDDAVSSRGVAKPAFLGVAGLALVALYAGAIPDHASMWLDRCVLLKDRPWPPRTQLEVRIVNQGEFRHEIDGDGVTTLYVPEDSAIVVEVEARGEVPASVTLRKFKAPRDENPTPVAIEMPQRGEGSLFEYKFGRVTADFDFYVEGGDDVDERPYFRVLVRSAPRIDAFAVDYDYPDYINEAGREDRVGVREYNVVGPRGTAVKLDFRTSAPVDRFEIIRDEKPEEAIILVPADDARRHFVWNAVLDRDGFYTYRMIGANGTPSREAPNFNFGAQTDLPPTISVTMPDSSAVEISERATVPFEIEVSDDIAVGEISLRWDTDRDGAFAVRWPLGPEAFRRDENGRDVVVFSPLEFNRVEVIGEDRVKRAPRAGDTFFLRIEARDTRRTETEPEPNLATYPTLITLSVRETAEIERELMRGQVRAKEQMERAEEAVNLRREEISALLAALGKGEEGPAVTERLHGLVGGQSLVTSSLSEAARGFVRIFDGHLFNRTDASNLTEALIGRLIEMHRAGGRSHYEHVAALLPAERSRFDETEPMGKLARIMDLMIEVADHGSPAVADALKEAIDADSLDARAARVQAALERETALQENLQSLIDKMEEWEDFQDVIQSLKDILDLQRGLSDRVESIAR
ncbi:MAG: hypothetical protein R3F20_08230 [Planctomycetota bacterium]